MVQMNLSAKQKERHRRREQMYGHQGGKAEWDELGGWDRHKCTTVYKTGLPQGSAVANSPAAQETKETQVRSLGQEDPLEKGMATHSSILAFPWTEEPGGLQPMGSHRVGHD